MDKTRFCYHPVFGEEVHTINVPILNNDNKVEGVSQAIFTEEEFLQWLYEFNDSFNANMPAFEIIQKTLKAGNSNKEVCCTAFVDMEMGTMIDMESACAAYNQLPYDGGFLDQPIRLMEAFDIIRGERQRFENVEADKLLSEAKSKNKTPKTSGRGSRKR